MSQESETILNWLEKQRYVRIGIDHRDGKWQRKIIVGGEIIGVGPTVRDAIKDLIRKQQGGTLAKGAASGR